MSFLEKFNRRRDKEAAPQSAGLWTRSLAKTRALLTADLGDLLRGKTIPDEALLEELETRLLMADVGPETTEIILKRFRAGVPAGKTLLVHLADIMVAILQPQTQPSTIPNHSGPHVVLIVGVNGSGKTTSIGKLAQHYRRMDCSVLLAAGDTFRAAAIEQLSVWAERNDVPIVAQTAGSDPAAVIFDALQSARFKNIDVLLADTAGRLHTQSGLMDELKKIKRVMQKVDPAAPHETLLVIDAGMGQNAVQQARQFHEAVGVTGLILTKMDGTAKGGIVFAIQQQLNLPVAYIGTGESADDLQPFEAEPFVKALLSGD
jgi:fused signal recognition particle receptor